MQSEKNGAVESYDSPRAVMDTSVFERQSQQNPDEDKLTRQDIQTLCKKIKSNHPDTVVFKMKDHTLVNFTSSVFDEILKCFWVNNSCEVMYIQNLSCVRDEQLMNLIDLLRVKKIWCLNLGEIYNVSNSGWVEFCEALPSTNVTHLYVSEHIISLNLKDKMRDYIRGNRKKHDLHSSTKNIRVIMRCTNMWWDPINTIKHPLQFPLSTTTVTKEASYHPTAQVYACSVCGAQSNKEDIMAGMNDEDMKELGEVFCKKHLSQKRSERLVEMRKMNLAWKDGEIISSIERSICREDKDKEEQRVESVGGEGSIVSLSRPVADYSEEVMGQVCDMERPDTPELARGEVSNDLNSSESPYGFEAFDGPSSVHISSHSSGISSSDVLQPQMDDLLLQPAAGNSDRMIRMGALDQGSSMTGCHDNFSTTTEADTESASSDLSRDGRAYSMGDLTSAMQSSSRQKDGLIAPPFLSNDLLYLTRSPNKQNTPACATDAAVPAQQEFGNYPLLTSLLGGPSTGNPQSAVTDVGRGFMAPGDMSYFPLRDLTRLTPTMTSLPSSLGTMVGDSVHRSQVAKAKMKPTVSSQQKIAAGMHRTPASSVTVDKKRISAPMPSSASAGVTLDTAAMAASHVRRKGNSKAATSPQKMTKPFVRQASDERTGDIHPESSSTSFAGKSSSLQAVVKAQVEAKKNFAIANSLLSRPDVKSEEDAKRPNGDCVAAAANPDPIAGLAAAMLPKAKLQIPSGADIARALAERKELQNRQSIETGSGATNKTGMVTAGPQGFTGLSRSTVGTSRPTLADLAKFREVSKKETKKDLKLKKDAAQQQALAASMLAASSALKQQRATSVLPGKSTKAVSVGPDGVLQGPPKKKRTSKGAKFRMYTRVFLPAFKIEGSITQEKNGGWKYVQFDVGIPLPLPPSLAACVPQSPRMNKGTLDGKWCRACDMEELCSSNGSESGSGLNSFGEQPFDNTEEDESGSYGSEDGSVLDGSEVGFRHVLPDGYDIKFDDDVATNGDDMPDSLGMRRKRDRADSMDASNNVFYSNSMSPSEREVVLALGMNTKLEDSMTGRGVSVAIGSAATMDDVGWHTIGLDDDTEDWNL